MKDEQEQGYWQGNPTSQPTNQEAPQTELGAAAVHSAYVGHELAQSTLNDEKNIEEKFAWEAPEYVHHAKDFTWFAGFGVITIIFMALAIWSQAWTFLALIVVMAITFIVFGLRPPRILHYELSHDGIKIDAKHFGYHEFRTFGVVSDGEDYSIVLVPIKRLLPAVNLHFNQQDGETIVDILSAYLPMEPPSQDPIDKLMRRLHF